MGIDEGRIRGPATIRACLDDECYLAHGELTQRRGIEKGPLVVLADDSQISVSLTYSDRELDEETQHLLRVSAQIGEGAQHEFERDFSFTEIQPNGPGCPPTCWFAHFTARDS